jgi:hypothetical protein
MPSIAKVSTPFSGIFMKPDASMIEGEPTAALSSVGLPCASRAPEKPASQNVVGVRPPPPIIGRWQKLRCRPA